MLPFDSSENINNKDVEMDEVHQSLKKKTPFCHSNIHFLIPNKLKKKFNRPFLFNEKQMHFPTTIKIIAKTKKL